MGTYGLGLTGQGEDEDHQGWTGPQRESRREVAEPVVWRHTGAMAFFFPKGH